MTDAPKPEITDDHLEAVRKLLAGSSAGSLSTLDETGGPYGSLVTYALDGDGHPLLLLSQLADHTRNLAGDSRASLLLEEAKHLKNPQTGPRATLVGTVAKADDAALLERFLARHPTASVYAGFADFSIYRLRVEKVHFVGGFGTAVWIDFTLFKNS